MDNDLKNFKIEKTKIKYLKLLQDATYYSINFCINDYEKVGLDETEKTCIKDRAYTYLTMAREFNVNQKQNFNSE